MNLRRRHFEAGLFVFALLGCAEGGVGDPCIPEDEYRTDFSGFALEETYVESRSFQCQTRMCLVNHFQGRVSCPGGQVDLSLPESDPRRCRVPDGSNAVDVPVRGWDIERPPEDAVYCSCRCDGPDPDAPYCDCPDGFQCEELVPDVEVAPNQVRGSYCVRANTEYQENRFGTAECTPESDDPICRGDAL